MNAKKSETIPDNNDFDATRTILNFPVVAIGASAGGLEALQEFFKNMSPEPEAAFVVIQHLSPDYKSYMNELLSRYTSIKIEIVKDGMVLEQNRIYLIPPKMNMTIFHGVFYLNELSSTRTLNLPIDIFFRSLAKDQEKNAVGIILSGAGSDGTLGIKAIKEFGGMTMAQDTKSAKFESMPHSSIATGMVDIVLPPSELAEELINYLKHPFVKQKRKIDTVLAGEQTQLSKVISIINETKNVDFSCYKENTIIRRLEKRISINRFEKIEEYIKFLLSNSKEINILFNELLIGVTRFFRDEAAFNSLKSLVIPKIIETARPNKEIRIWVSACSTGEEAYSIAILFKEYLTEKNISKEIRIFATDLDKNSLEFASIGFYPDNIVSDVSTERISKFFTKKENGYQVNDNIRSMIVFARQNIINDPPFSKLDLITCRNFLIYVNTETQQKVLSIFNVALNDNGYLFLGSSESLGNISEGYKNIDTKSKLFQKQLNYKPLTQLGIKRSTDYKSYPELLHTNTLARTQKGKNRFLEVLFDQIMVDYLPPSVVIDENCDILHTINNVNDYLHIPSGQITINLLKMLSKENSLFVSSLIRRASKNNDEMVYENIESKIIGKQLSISCKKITDKVNSNTYYLISFVEKDLEQKKKKFTSTEKVDVQLKYNERIDELERELQQKSESLQATVEELETSNEELQSSNEELIASNEELQSTNEELQSVNEELYTVNSEHIRKIEELTELTSDMENLLRNTQIGTLYLDQKLVIRKVNDVASKLTNIITTDVGRPLKHLAFSNFDVDLIGEIEKVSRSLQLYEKEIQDKTGRYYLMNIIPYRMADNAVEGIIVTFVNITKLKQSEAKLFRSENDLHLAQQITKIGSWYLDIATNEVQWTEELYKIYGFDPTLPPPPYTEHQKLFTPESWEILSSSLQRTHETGIPYVLELQTVRSDGSNGWMWVRGETVKDKAGNTIGLWGAAHDISERKNLEMALDMGGMSWWEWDVETNTVKTGDAKYTMLGYAKEEIAEGYQGYTRLIHPDDFQKAMKAMKDHLEGKASHYMVKYRIRHKNGNYIWYMDKGGIVSFTKDGKPKLLMGIVMNITDDLLG